MGPGETKAERRRDQFREASQRYREKQFDIRFASQQGRPRAVDWRTATPPDILPKTSQHAKSALPPLRFKDAEEQRIKRKTAAARDWVVRNLAKGRSAEAQKILDCLSLQSASTSTSPVDKVKTGGDLAAENIKAIVQVSKRQRTTDARSYTAAAATSACPGTARFIGRKKVALATGISERTLSKRNAQRRSMRALEYNAEWGLLLAKKMCRQLKRCADEDVQCAQKYWEDYCPPMNKYGTRGTARKCTSAGLYICHKKHLLRGSEAECYSAFKLDHPDVAAWLKFMKYKQCKPYFIVKQTQRDVCLTYQDIHIRHLVRDLMQQLGKKGTTSPSLWRSELCTCAPDAKLCAKNLPNTLRGMIDVLLCPRPEGERFHLISCLEGSCDKCGIKRLKMHQCPILWNDKPAKWHEFFRFEDSATGKKVYKECAMPCKHDRHQRPATRSVMMDHLVDYLQTWGWFDFIGEHQMKQILFRMESLSRNVLALSMDFAAVFSWEAAEDAQSAHYSRQTIRILVCVVRRQWDEKVDGELVDLTSGDDGAASGWRVLTARR